MDVRQTALSKMSKEELLDGLSKGELTIVEYLKYAEKVDSKTQANSRRTQDFLMILYPEDPKHVALLEYIKQYEHIWQFAYILHDRDIWDEDDEEVQEGKYVAGDPKKPHWHVLIHRKERSTASAQSNFFCVTVKPCSSVEGSLMYFVHKTAKSVNKAQYDWEDLKGSKKLLDKVLIQKSHFVQLRYFVSLAQKGYSLSDMVSFVERSGMSSQQKNEFLEFFLSHGYLLGLMSNQELARDKERMRYAQFADYAVQASRIGSMQEISDIDAYFNSCVQLGVNV